MMPGLEGRVALVGGGSRGLGRAAALRLAEHGMAVAVYARNEERLARAAAELAGQTGADVLPVVADVRDPEACAAAVERVLERFGRLDVLVTNMAGDEYHADVLAASDDLWLAEFELYALSVVRMARAAVPPMRQAGAGAIVNISSCGVHQLIPELALSEVIRLATTGFAKYLATQLAPEAIRVNSVLPGWISGELIDELLAEDAARRGVTPEIVRAESTAPIPMGRFGEAVDVANAIAFLASDAARYITGVNLRVDGGWALTPTS